MEKKPLCVCKNSGRKQLHQALQVEQSIMKEVFI